MSEALTAPPAPTATAPRQASDPEAVWAAQARARLAAAQATPQADLSALTQAIWAELAQRLAQQRPAPEALHRLSLELAVDPSHPLSPWPDCARAALQDCPDSLAMARRVLHEAARRLDDALHQQAYAQVCRLMTTGDPDLTPLHAMTARIRYAMADMVGALAACGHALAGRPDHLDMQTLRLMAALEARVGGGAVTGPGDVELTAWAASLADLPGLDPAGVNACYQAWSQVLPPAALAARLARLAQAPGLDPAGRAHAEKLARAASRPAVQVQRAAGRSVALAVPGDPHEWCVPEGCRHVVLWFCGLAGVMPRDQVRAALRARGLGVVFLQDVQRVGFTSGLAGLGVGLAASAQALRARLPAHVSTLSCAGSSLGGYGAVLYALALGARNALSLGGLTTLLDDPDVPDVRGKLIRARAAQLAPDQVLDLAPLLAAADPPLALHLWHGALHPEDCAHARHLAGLPGVQCHALPGLGGHDVLWELVASGRLGAALDLALMS
ncbi:hypothetical protein [Ideonella livida]|uniref:Uncharacterized protein n=1 Tax=Ideonella livida TaxID=2707176 RepID=A0A7C9TM28_9BURK|nr:hypothetical protein [Ideonella livida]NDY93939.1 hypothetical protein [Ideonella livida]